MLKILNNPFVLWFLSTIVIGIFTFGYAVWRELGATLWSNWDAKRLLIVEMSYRYSYAYRVYHTISNSKNGELNGRRIGEILDNREDGERFNYVVPRLRERPFDSLHWDLIRRYSFEHPDRERLEFIRKICYEWRFQNVFDQELEKRSKEGLEEFYRLWKSHLEKKPPKYLIPK